MKLFFITFAAAALLSTTALANPPGNQGGGNGGCGVGQQTNGCGSTTPTTTTASVNIDSHNVNVLNKVDNSVHDSSIRNTLTTGSSTSTSQGGSASVGNLSTGPSTSSAVTGASTSNASTGPSSASSQSGGNVQDVHFDSSPRQVASAIAPALILPSCTDGGSGAIQGTRIGISIGGSKQAKGCERRAYAAMLDSLGQREAAILVLSNDPEVNQAMTTVRSRK